MQTEYEIKVLEIHIEEIQKKLKDMGATFIGEKFQKRYVYNMESDKLHTWLRLRTDGTKTTLTIKEIHDTSIRGTKEVEVTIDNFEEMHTILTKLGFTPTCYQENKRISYTLDNVEIEIDSWPRIPPYLEVEGPSAKAVVSALTKLGYTEGQCTSMNTIDVYKKYGIDLHTIKELTFN